MSNLVCFGTEVPIDQETYSEVIYDTIFVLGHGSSHFVGLRLMDNNITPDFLSFMTLVFLILHTLGSKKKAKWNRLDILKCLALWFICLVFERFSVV